MRLNEAEQRFRGRRGKVRGKGAGRRSEQSGEAERLESKWLNTTVSRKEHCNFFTIL